MDIDEFLDRELADLALPLEKTKKPEIASTHVLKEELKPSPLFQNAKASLSVGNLEQAEQSYLQLWEILSRHKLTWDNEIYDQLLILSRQFSSILNQAYSDAKIKINHIYELLNRARTSLREGRKDIAFKLYSQIDEINASIPAVFFEEKKMVQDQISDFYKELRSTTDNELIKRISNLVKEINQLIDKINMSITANDVASTIENYNKCIELYNKIPEGFLRHKNSLGMKILDIYKGLSIHKEISTLQKQLSTAISMRHAQPAQPAVISATNFTTQKNHVQAPASNSMSLKTKKESAKKNLQKGLYEEASKEIEEVLQLEPKDAEARAIYARIKTLQ